MDDEFDDGYDDDPYDDEGFDDLGALDDAEHDVVVRDLQDLERFESAFRPSGYRGVTFLCDDCDEDHFYPWDMLRENLSTLLQTGDVPVHEPAFAPDPDQYVPWEYAKGYVDALADVGADDRLPLDRCECGLDLSGPLAVSNFCPRCGRPLLAQRLVGGLAALGLDESEIRQVLVVAGMPMR